MMRSLCTTALLFSFAAISHANDNLKAFPPADQGMTRYVLELPKQRDESSFKVELIIGKTVQTDKQNRYFYTGKIKEESIEGWGYTRYIVDDLGPMAGTLMAADPAEPKVSRFITLSGEPRLFRYNSRLPVVVYVPNDAEVRYRIWSAGKKTRAIKKG
jgi:ecotin